MIPPALSSATLLKIEQRKELAEVFGFETRNKYAVQLENGSDVLFIAEERKGGLDFLARQFLGHWRSFTLKCFDANRLPVCEGKHPFRFYFQELEVRGERGELLGTMKRRFSFLSKKFDVLTPDGRVALSVNSPIWKIWTFRFFDGARERAVIRKKWGGILREAVLDADKFELEFLDPSVDGNLRLVLAMACAFVDLMYFEKKAQ